ncbi:Uncharacterized protein YNL011C [Zea mays]|uniref:Uncharacterized protein YNL011C n=1 Tax=Zea mays TaxID=4577 RepID=A0A3L6FHB8_MAIZE|nr:Uncharacterized protein YNL011C [Zea mays]
MALVACPRCNITLPQASACGSRGLLRVPRSAASRPPPWHLRRSRAMAVYEGWHSAAAGADTDGGAPAPHVPPSLLVFSGGTAFNGVVEELKKVTTRVAHVLPVSDDGGSTAEIVRVLGGPAVGDIRSRCLRLSDESTAEALSVRKLLGHRLPIDPSEAKLEWYQIVEGDHTLWEGVSRPYRETIRAFLVYFHSEVCLSCDVYFDGQLKCFASPMAGDSSKVKFVIDHFLANHHCFSFIGNFFFAGARIFFQSLDAAIFLFSRVSQIPAESLVLPVISTNDRLTLGCELWDGTIIRGQNEISHPSNGRREIVNKVLEDYYVEW